MRQILARSQLFAQMDAKALEQIASAGAIKNANRGEMLFCQGDIAHSFYVVGTGKVKVFKDSADGKQQILMIAGPGDSFAEAALFSGSNFPASAQTLEKSKLAVFDRTKFVALMGKNPDLAVNLIVRLSELLRKMTKLVEGLSLSDVTTRLAHYLLELERDDSGRTYAIRLSEKKSILASQLGTIPETLSRSFARLVKENIITIEGSRIDVLDAARLRQFAGSE